MRALKDVIGDRGAPEEMREQALFAISQQGGADAIVILRKVAEDMGDLLAGLAKQLRDPDVEPEAALAEQFSHKLAEDRRTARPQILEATAAQKIDADRALNELRAQRWLDRLAYHVWRAAHHLREMTRKEMPAEISGAADAGVSGPERKPDGEHPPAAGE